VKQFLVERLIAIARPHRQEDISTDAFMDDLAVSRQAVKYYLLISLQWYLTKKWWQ